MGAKVSNFFKEVAKTAAKAATSFALGKVPVVGDALANKINSMYKKGGKVKPFADGGEVQKFAKPTQEINTPAQLISVIKKLPEEAAKAGLSVSDVKEAVADAKKGEVQAVAPVASTAVPVEAKKRGGRKKKAVVEKSPNEKTEAKKRGGRKKKVDTVELYAAKAHGGRVNLTPSIF